ncbi:hypothetical protein OF83DRAFT_1176146 [Amylostereum chailletii]|nr:hypothetical protein OF83DRAFT_1176146 [Amylostereum chailletii]
MVYRRTAQMSMIRPRTELEIIPAHLREHNYLVIERPDERAQMGGETLVEALRRIRALETDIRLLKDTTVPASKEVRLANVEVRRTNELFNATAQQIMDRHRLDRQTAEWRAVYRLLVVLGLGVVIGFVTSDKLSILVENMKWYM